MAKNKEKIARSLVQTVPKPFMGYLICTWHLALVWHHDKASSDKAKSEGPANDVETWLQGGGTALH